MSKKRRKVKLILLNMLFIILCIGSMIPIIYALSVSLDGKNDLLSSSFSIIPNNFTLANYEKVFIEEPFLMWMKNSLILVVSTVVISMCIAVPAAYAFSRFRFVGRKTVLYILLLLNAFPTILSMFAIYRLLRPFGLINSYTGLVIIYVGTMATFGIWNMKGYFDTIPKEIEQAGRIDGCNDFQVVTRLVLPLAKPAIVVTCVMILIFVWNEYIFAVTFLSEPSKYTLAGGLYSLQATQYTRNWPIFSASSIAVSIPVLIIFFAMQRYMVAGLTIGGVKG